MDKAKWDVFIQHYWNTITYSQMTHLYRTVQWPDGLGQSFFAFNFIACRNDLLMNISHMVHLSEVIAGEYDVGLAARAALVKLKSLYEQGDTKDHSVVAFPKCGVKVYRDKIIAHPLNPIKEALGKETYDVSLEWSTVQETLDALKAFADEVEDHQRNLGNWDFETVKTEVFGVEESFSSITLALEDAAKYDQLRLAILKMGTAKVSVDCTKDHDIVIEK